MKKGS